MIDRASIQLKQWYIGHRVVTDIERNSTATRGIFFSSSPSERVEVECLRSKRSRLLDNARDPLLPSNAARYRSSSTVGDKHNLQKHSRLGRIPDQPIEEALAVDTQVV